MKNKRIAERIKKNIAICAVIVIMAVIYAVMMFTNGPWYDELYTYYSFISRGPIYAAIHWPVPNNHVGYSVLSAVMGITGNPYIALRGVSYISALLNIGLVYSLCLRFSRREYAFIASIFYLGANIIHNLSVQGRGYTLAITCMLIASICCYEICMGRAYIKYYFGFAMSLLLGLYIIPSSLYWVLPLCMVGGVFLLDRKEWNSLIKLVISGVVAAVGTLGLYTIIWLAIGANLLSKDPNSLYYGVYQVSIILKAPIASASRGIEYMLATPYIQSIDRYDAVIGLPGYFRDLFGQCYSRIGEALCVLMVALVIIGIRCYLSDRKSEVKIAASWSELYVVGILLLVPAMLMIQSVHPYKRVLAFVMVQVAIGFALLMAAIVDRVKDDVVRRKVSQILAMLLIIFVGFKMTTYDYRRPFADRENDIYETLRAMEESGTDVSDIDSIYYTDDFQKYVLKFYYDAEPAEVSLEEAQCVMVSSDIRDESIKNCIWPMLVTYDEELLTYINNNFTKQYFQPVSIDLETGDSEENSKSGYIIYVR